MLRKQFLACLAAAAGVGCGRVPESYPPPEQRKSVLPASAEFSSYVKMDDPRIDWYLLDGVSTGLEGGGWRWAFRRPRLRFFLRRADALEFRMQFAVAGSTFQETGPVTLRVLVNGRPIGSFHYDSPGDKTLTAPVPPSVVKPNAPNEVAIEPDKVWISKLDGAALSFILVGAGFIQK